MNSPRDILNYVVSNNLEFDFLTAITNQHNNFSIAEITDKKLEMDEEGNCRLKSLQYKLNLDITDDEIVTAVVNELYVSAFISRRENNFNIHFLVHQYPEIMKPRFEENITNEVIQYMIMNTIITLRLDTFKKVDNYING